MGEHAARPLVDHLERADDADGLAVPAGLVGERHAVQSERGGFVTHEHAVGEPRPERRRRPFVPAGAVGLAWDVDPDDVVRVP